MLDHLIAAAEQERERLAVIHEAVGEDWPPGYDANDIPLYDAIIRSLRDTLRSEKQRISFSGKSLNFLLLALPIYVRSNRSKLSDEEYSELRSAYALLPWQVANPDAFPE
jgi:hypothetical protein